MFCSLVFLCCCEWLSGMKEKYVKRKAKEFKNFMRIAAIIWVVQETNILLSTLLLLISAADANADDDADAMMMMMMMMMMMIRRRRAQPVLDIYVCVGVFVLILRRWRSALPDLDA